MPSRVTNEWVEVHVKINQNTYIYELVRETCKQKSHQGQVYLFIIIVGKTEC